MNRRLMRSFNIPGIESGIRYWQEVNLSPTEYRLLQYLATNGGKVIVQEELQAKVWGPEYREHYEGLGVYIQRLRQKIEKEPEHPTYVITKPGIGYMLASPD